MTAYYLDLACAMAMLLIGFSNIMVGRNTGLPSAYLAAIAALVTAGLLVARAVFVSS